MPTPTVAAHSDVARDLDRRSIHRRHRYEAQRVVWKHTGKQRIAYCGRFVSDKAGGVAVKVSGVGADARAGFGGLQTCGSVWGCPVCSEKINAERQQELEAGISWWMSQGGSVLFGTLTARHNRGHSLDELLHALAPAWNRTTSGAGVQWNGSKKKDGEIGDRARFGIAGYVRALEIKHGRHGWHPHIHFLLFTKAPLNDSSIRDLENRMYSRWEKSLADRGLSVIREVGIDLRQVEAGDAGLAAYFTKATYQGPTAGRAAYEVTGSQSKRLGKGGRSPFQILGDLVEADAPDLVDEATGEVVPSTFGADLALWHEYEEATWGRRQLTWSRGLRALLALGVERSDQEIAEDEAGGEIAFVFRRDEWETGGWAYRKVQLLEAAEAGTLAALLLPVLLARRSG